MTIWSLDNHIRHPWFDNPLRKRKHSLPESSCSTASSDESDTSERRRPVKRRRCSGLEQGIAHLSLDHSPFKNVIQKYEPRIGELAQLNKEGSCAIDAGEGVGGHTLSSVLLPSSVEEPEPDIPEIQMKTLSWYELAPDRIVITDLDSFDSEDDSEKEDSVKVNKTLLQHINSQQPLLAPGLIPPLSQALVLFRPFPMSDGWRNEFENVRRSHWVAVENEETEVARRPVDVEPMEVEP